MTKNENANCNMADQEMREVPGLRGYEITRDGKLFSVRRKRFLRGEVSSTKKFGLCYQKYLVRQNGKSVNLFAHRLVYLTYVGMIPEELVVHHVDGDGLNNWPENLQLMTRSEHSAKIMIRWYLCQVYPPAHDDRTKGVSIPDIARKYYLTNEVIKTVLEKTLGEILKDLEV